MYTIELNNIQKDEPRFNNKFNKNSMIVEVFSAMVQGQDLARFGANADKCAKYICQLGEKAEMGDMSAVAELNTLRRFAIEPHVMEEAKLLGVFGSYKNVGYNETVEVEYTQYIGVDSAVKIQAEGLDVGTPALVKKRVRPTSQLISGGYAVDYRQVALGDMTNENQLQEEVRKQIRNKAVYYVMKTVFDAIENAQGVKYFEEGAGITKPMADRILTNVRRFGKPTVTGDYALLSQFTPWAGYVGDPSRGILGISEKTMDKIAEDGMLSVYNGNILKELPNPYDLTKLTADGKNFETVLPQGLGIVVPAGGASPVHTFTRGGLTSCTGLDVTTGKIVTRFDLETMALVEPTNEFKIGILHDTNLDTL